MTASDFDRLRAAVHHDLLATLPRAVDRLGWSAEQVAARQREGLRALLVDVAEHSPFHARRLGGIDASTFELTDLPRLPVMTKAQMMASLDDVFTDRRLSRPRVEEALAATTVEPVPILHEYVAMASGGSSGQRGVFVFDRDALVGFLSSLLRVAFARLEALGGAPPGGLPVAMVGAASAVHATGAAAGWSSGGAAPFWFRPVPVTLPLEEIVERLNALQPPLLYGYASILARLAAEQEAGGLRIAPMSITSTSETLLPGLRAAIVSGFGVPVVDSYGSTEGLVGTSAPDDEVLAFNTDLCIVELVDEDNRPVPLGAPSAKILLTNLYNRAQPLIRYELNDSFVQQPAAADGHLRATVCGRTDEVLHFDDDVDVHPLVVRAVLVKSPAVADYRVVQTPRGIEVDLLAAGPNGACDIDVAALRGELADALAMAGLRHPTVEARVVDDLPRHPETGKLRRFIPLTRSGA